MTKRYPRLITPLLFLLILTLLAGCSRPSQSETPPESAQTSQPLAVEVLEVTKGTLINEIKGSGTVSGIREAMVVSQTQGIIEAVSFELGKQVSKDEVLVQVDSEIARLNMEQAKEQLENARIDYQTKENLVEKGGASRADLLRARSALRGAEARYKQTQKTFEDCSLTSPISGFIAEKQSTATIGNFLSTGTQVAKVVDLSTLRLQISVGEGMIGQFREGSRASVTIPAACGGESYAAEVVAIAAGSDPGTGSYPVILEFENTCGPAVKSGMSAEATILPTVEAEHLIIPSSALARRNGEDVVFVAEEGKARVQPIQTGRRIGNRVEVLEGLQAGDLLIISGITSLSDGDAVSSTTIGESGSRQ
ncbi:MAG: efflux RND transporter periplasmic adaptor subunit [bacterium]